jgi:hypothetical protein
MKISIFWGVTPLLTSAGLHAIVSQNVEFFLTLLTGSWLCASRRPVRYLPRDAYEFDDLSACLMADNVCNEGK